MKEALRQLRELQTERREREKTEMDDAIRLLKTQKMKGEFVYASPEITAEFTRRDRLQDALLAEQSAFHLTRYHAPQGRNQPQPTGRLDPATSPRSSKGTGERSFFVVCQPPSVQTRRQTNRCRRGGLKTSMSTSPRPLPKWEIWSDR